MAVTSGSSFVVIAKGVTAPGTAEQVAEHFIPEGMEIKIKARRKNRGDMFFAFTKADAEGTNRVELTRGEKDILRIDNTNRIWVDADFSTDRLEIVIQKRG